MTKSFFTAEIDISKYQVVEQNMFIRVNEPNLSIANDGIYFNKRTHHIFNNCDYIKIMINQADKSILITPTTSGEPNAIDWKRMPSKEGKISCTTFVRLLLKAWGLNKDTKYRSIGRLVQADNRPMLMFSFKNPEIVIARPRGKKNV